MKIAVERNSFMKALGHIQNVAERRNSVPILSHVLIEAKEGKLWLRGTDMEIELLEVLDATVEEEGATTVRVDVLNDLIKRLPAGSDVKIQQDGDDNQLRLHGARLNVLDAADFPRMGEMSFTHHFSIPTQDLISIIDKTRPSISLEETRYYLNGVFFHVHEDEGLQFFRAVSTDGHRLARVEIKAPEGSVGMPGVIVPRKTVLELRKILDEVGGEVKVSLSDTRIQFSEGDVILTSKLVDGSYPDYERVIPKSHTRTLTVSKEKFYQTLSYVAAVSRERSRPIKLEIEGQELVMSSGVTEYGSVREVLGDDFITYEGEEGPFEVGFQARYLSDIMEQIGEKAQFFFTDNVAPAVVKDPEDTSALYILMPMRV